MSTLLDHINLARLRLRGFSSQYALTPDGRMHALVGHGGGPLPPLVLIAGLSSRATHFNRLAPHLAGRAGRVVLVDLPGHGLSEIPPDGLTGPSLQRGVLAALDQLIDEPAIVFGNSLGGFMALRHALQSPAKVRGLVLASPGGAAMEGLRLVEFMERFRPSTHRAALDLIDRVFFQSPPGVRQLMAFFARRQLSQRHIRHLITSSRPEHMLTRDELRQLQVPVRMLWGTADTVLPSSHLAFFRDALPHADWATPPDYGHSPYIERPADVAERIVDFAERHAPQPALRLVEAS